MKRYLFPLLLLISPVFAQEVNTQQRSLDLASQDLGQMHRRIIELIAKDEQSQMALVKANGRIKELEDKYEPKARPEAK